MDLLIGVLASVLANIHRDRKAQPFTPLDFMPYHAEERDRVKQQQRRERNRQVYEKARK